MKYAINFYQGCPILNVANEIIISYNEKNTNLIDFVQKYRPSQRIVVSADPALTIEDNIDIFNAARERHPYLAIRVAAEHNHSLLKESGIDFFFADYVSTLDQLDAFVAEGVSDIYIVNELGFMLKDIGEYCHSKNINVRVLPNVAQTSSTLKNSNSIRSFFIRPEDMTYYEPFVDILEFFGPLDKQPVLYKIYKDGHWDGDLNMLILDLNTEVDSRTIPAKFFGLTRLNCKKICALGKCVSCDLAMQTAALLEERKIGFKPIKKGETKDNGSGFDENVGTDSTRETDKDAN